MTSFTDAPAWATTVVLVGLAVAALVVTVVVAYQSHRKS